MYAIAKKKIPSNLPSEIKDELKLFQKNTQDYKIEHPKAKEVDALLVKLVDLTEEVYNSSSSSTKDGLLAAIKGLETALKYADESEANDIQGIIKSIKTTIKYL